MTVILDSNRQEYMAESLRREQTDKYLVDGNDFIPDREIHALLDAAKPDPEYIRDILKKSLAIQTLEPAEMAALLQVEDDQLLAEMAEAAIKTKHFVYDNRIVTFAPLYMSNLCVNRCAYCGFSTESQNVQRRKLSMDEVRSETNVLAGKIGHKRLIVVYGEHPSTSTEYIADTITNVYDVKAPTRHGFGQIRRVNVNAAPLPVEDLKHLHEVGIGTYQVFQETYHKETYREVHPAGTIKGDYRWRLYCMHRALEAGVDDVGMGALFGLYNWKFDALALLYHARELEARYNIGPHTLSFPRIEPACDSLLARNPNDLLTDRQFKKLIIVLRLSVPYSGMIITARENRATRDECIPLGCTQTDASSRIGIGSYSDVYTDQEEARQQFILGDTRSLEELVVDLAKQGVITSFCTAGYRCGRTGGCIMDMLKTGKEGTFCKLNAVLTFREWLDDFASPESLAICEPVIQKEIEGVRAMVKPEFFEKFEGYYKRICSGERDLYF
ncbi:MAG: [FeFe] hydrogenase H-cluster radical SAM maturase HydG [Kiritimatiellae bacterium]|nr:[FeFe] hydrogenase H-cluster radical SAM maturase HydG [Kiritimatiellia bacterium]MDD4736371.1 [FeFe] hydrogenase H-cluster radical SAM maturase HydG [Kiritimatiellia bacterium]